MELEEMQAAWSEMSSQLEQQKKLTDDIILKMTKQNYNRLWNRIRGFEIVGTVICYAALIYLLTHFTALVTVPEKVGGVICILCLAGLPIASLKTIGDMKSIDLGARNYKDMIKAYARNRKRFVNFQKINFGFSFLFMFAIMPVMTRLWKQKDFFANLDAKMLYVLPITVLVFALFIWYVSRFYKGIVAYSNSLLEEVKD